MCHLLFSLILQYHADLEISNFCLTGFIHIYASCIFILVSSREDSRIKNLHSSRLQTSFFNLHVLMSCHEDVLLSCYEDTLLACILACILFCLSPCILVCLHSSICTIAVCTHELMHPCTHNTASQWSSVRFVRIRVGGTAKLDAVEFRLAVAHL